jgi:D-beta-D-heptose 7-phosphate kinase/D-beta-D-heptose 1-phosphate adenosyltransferase
VLTDATRTTTHKERLLARVEQRQFNQILRVDYEQTHPLAAELAELLTLQVEAALPEVDVVLISDYAKGTCTPELLTRVIGRARDYGLPVLVDPARIADYARHRGATLLKPNRSQTERATGQRIAATQDALDAARQLVRQYGFDAVVVTLDGDGMVLAAASPVAARGDASTSPEIFAEHVPTRPRAVCDVTGAGDLVLTLLGLCLAAGRSLRQAVELANVAAGLEVERVGVAPVTWREIAEAAGLMGTAGRGVGGSGQAGSVGKLVTLDEMCTLAASYRREGKTVVFTNGCFDLLHAGHVTYLQQAARLGEVLVVALNSDASVRRLKGPQRPVIAEHDRAVMLAALSCVDHVLIFEEATPHCLLERIRPHVLVKGGTTPTVVGSEIVAGYGGTVRILDAVHDVSTW